MEVGILIIQSSQTIGWYFWERLRSLEIGFNVEMGITVLLVQPPTFLHDLGYFPRAGFDGFFVGCKCVDSRYRALRGMCCSTFRIQIVRQDGEDLSGMFGCELVPELINVSLGRLLPHGQPWARDGCCCFLNHAGRSRVRSYDVDEVVMGAARCHGHA